MDNIPEPLNTIIALGEILQAPLTGYLLYLNWILWKELTKVQDRQARILNHLLKLDDSEALETHDL